MLAAYGVDTLDPAVSTRRVHVLLDRLPPDARRPGEQWSTEAELLALLIDHVANLTWVTLRAAGAKNATRPTPLRRPPARRQHRPQPQPQRAAGSRGAPDGERKTGSWLDAAAKLAAIPGVVVSNDGLLVRLARRPGSRQYKADGRRDRDRRDQGWRRGGQADLGEHGPAHRPRDRQRRQGHRDRARVRRDRAYGVRRAVDQDSGRGRENAGDARRAGQGERALAGCRQWHRDRAAQAGRADGAGAVGRRRLCQRAHQSRERDQARHRRAERRRRVRQERRRHPRDDHKDDRDRQRAAATAGRSRDQCQGCL
jgi:hypothetical protein